MRVDDGLRGRVLDVARQMCAAYGQPHPMDHRVRAVVTQYAAIAQGAGCSVGAARSSLAALRLSGDVTVEVVRGRGVRLVCRG